MTSLFSYPYRQAKLQEIADKHLEVMKVAGEAEGALNDIQLRKDDLAKQANWSQPAILQQHMLIAEVRNSLIGTITHTHARTHKKRTKFNCQYRI